MGTILGSSCTATPVTPLPPLRMDTPYAGRMSLSSSCVSTDKSKSANHNTQTWTPIQTTLIRLLRRASMTPWILTVCWKRPSAAWEGNQLSGAQHLCHKEELLIPQHCFSPLRRRDHLTFYALSKSTWEKVYRPILYYIINIIIMNILKSLHEHSCWGAGKKHFVLGMPVNSYSWMHSTAVKPVERRKKKLFDFIFSKHYTIFFSNEVKTSRYVSCTVDFFFF